MSGTLITEGNFSQLKAEDDRALILHALRWVNSGGSPESEIAERFGCTARIYYRRVLALLESDSPEFDSFGLGSVITTRMKAVARKRVWPST